MRRQTNTINRSKEMHLAQGLIMASSVEIAKEGEPMALAPDLIERAARLFRAKQWNTDTKKEKSFDRFCETLSILNADEIEMMFSLTDDFLSIEDIEYRPRLISILDDLADSSKFNKVKRFYILPLVDPNKLGLKARSGHVVSANFQHGELFEHNFFNGQRLFFPEDLCGIPRDLTDRDSLVIIVDDFIGSGESAESCLNGLRENKTIPNAKVLFITIVIQNLGLVRLEGLGVNVAYDELRFKGISDNSDDMCRKKHTQLMTAVEKRLQIREELKFGYARTEALVKMWRIPNNTFPVYWEESVTTEKKTFRGTFYRN